MKKERKCIIKLKSIFFLKKKKGKFEISGEKDGVKFDIEIEKIQSYHGLTSLKIIKTSGEKTEFNNLTSQLLSKINL